MAQLMHMDARLDTLSDELCQVTTCVCRIVQRQVLIGGYTVASFLKASKDKSDGSNSADDAKDDADGSPINDEMST